MKVLLADDDAERAGALAGVLAADPGLTVLRLDPAITLADAVMVHAPDIVLVDMARPDRDALDGIMSKGRRIVDVAADVIWKSEGPRE
jgi:two-component system, response regulator / RNA-binding antiterminator